MVRKSAWLLSAGLVALSFPAQARAQDTDTDQSGAQPTDGATAEGAAVDDQAVEQGPTDSGDIIITATRRNEALSDVPLAVSAISAESLENSGATDIKQMQQLSPSLYVNSTQSEAGASRANIRGIGTVGDNPGLEASVGVFIDGVYRSRTGTALNELGPVERVEVLRGPQGTLFGRNTSAGLISVITAKPKFVPEVAGEFTVGNYDHRRLELSGTGPIGESIAARLDGVLVKRDGVVDDLISGRDVNDRDRWLLRGQLLFEPSDNTSFRLIADYAKRDEECCAAPYIPASDFTVDGRQDSTAKPLLEGLGAIIPDDPDDRNVVISEGRSYRQDVKDWGLSGELVHDFGGAELTSITAYRYNNLIRGTDVDYSNLDIIYRDDDGGAFNRFRTFSQEVRLQGEAMGGKLDWLVGGYFADERLRSREELRYGEDFDELTNCLVSNNFAQGLIATGNPAFVFAGQNLVRPGEVGCVNPALVAPVSAGLGLISPSQQFVFNSLTRFGPFTGQTGNVFENLTRVPFGPFATAPDATFAEAGVLDDFRQRSRNLAFFTHNIFSITDRLKATIGLRYTRETKTLNADFSDNNIACTIFSGTTLNRLPCLNPSALEGDFDLDGKRKESNLSGTGVLSYKPTDSTLLYASYSRGYKAGGFNLDRSVLTRQQVTDPTTGAVTFGAICPTSGPLPAGCARNASAEDLEFKPETNEAVELGMKFNGRVFDVNVAVFNQLFKNFQLNTFNGVNFEVANINSCEDGLEGADSDASILTGACDGGTRAGVRSRGVELEIFSRPLPNVNLNVGVTYADARYRNNLVGKSGAALSPSLFQLPGERVSGSAKLTLTSSFAWTPQIGSGGLRGLFYIDMRKQSKSNTGSDLDLEKIENGYTVFNARVGLTGRDRMWGIELWANNLFDEDYYQIAFDAFGQGSGTQRGVESGFYPRSNQLFGVFVGDPRTYGLTLRGKLGAPRAAAPAYVAPPAPP
ncbi:MAG: TonB-dependent receptor, partial [Sphingomonas sp.]|nr:TonB-dependent receptor [Sphingomonas sp.]